MLKVIMRSMPFWGIPTWNANTLLFKSNFKPFGKILEGNAEILFYSRWQDIPLFWYNQECHRAKSRPSRVLQ